MKILVLQEPRALFTWTLKDWWGRRVELFDQDVKTNNPQRQLALYHSSQSFSVRFLFLLINIESYFGVISPTVEY